MEIVFSYSHYDLALGFTTEALPDATLTIYPALFNTNFSCLAAGFCSLAAGYFMLYVIMCQNRSFVAERRSILARFLCHLKGQKRHFFAEKSSFLIRCAIVEFGSVCITET